MWPGGAPPLPHSLLDRMGQRRGIAAGSLPPRRHACSWPGSAPTARYAVLDEAAFADRADEHAAAPTRCARRSPRASARGSCSEEPGARGRRGGGGGRRRHVAIDTDPRSTPRSGPPPCSCTSALFRMPTPRPRCAWRAPAPTLRARARGRLPGWRAAAADRRPVAHGDRLERRASGAARARARSADDLALPLAIVFGVLGPRAARARHRPRRRPARAASGRPGLAVAAAGGLLAAAITGGPRRRARSSSTPSFGDAVVSQVWTAYLGDLRIWALALGAGRPGRRRGGRRAAAVGRASLLATPAVARRRGCCARLGLLAVAALAVALPELVLHIGLVTLAAIARLRRGGRPLARARAAGLRRPARRARRGRRPPRCWR